MNSAKNNQKNAALLIGFGGPTRPEEVRPFIRSVVEGLKIPEERLQEVEKHYEAIGGRSPFNEITYRQKEALERFLKTRSVTIPVGVAFRHSTPSFRDAFETFKKFGIEKVAGFVLASFRSHISSQGYREKVLQARDLADAGNIQVDFTLPFESDPLYLEAQAERLHEIWDRFTVSERASTHIIFTAHSIPSSLCERSTRENQGQCYGYQFRQAARVIAGLLDLGKNWTCAYQSRSGNPQDAWLDPDVKDVIRGLDKKKFRTVLLVPVGFLCDNVEIIYDLDIEAKKICDGYGLRYARALTVMDHPKFIEMMGRQILERL